MEVRGWGLLGSLLVTAGRSPPPLALRGAESPQPPALSGMAKAPCPPQSGLRSMTRSQGGTKTWHPHPESGMVCGAVPASRLLGFGPRPAWTPCHSSASPAAAPAPPSPAAGGNPGTGRPGTASETRPAPPNPGASPSAPHPQFPVPVAQCHFLREAPWDFPPAVRVWPSLAAADSDVLPTGLTSAAAHAWITAFIW